ncbi:MAG TPA: hypothetical protein VKX45_17305 [Bryobacteraceae bacterium]|jgi:hypothetical protein|nr:hypothetical protein [Bryobacteraceae bacterium]
MQVLDTQKGLSQLTKDGRHPDLTLGVWGPRGFYYPARLAGGPATAGAAPAGAATYTYRVAIPLDTTLKLHISSRDLKLGDANGAALPANANQQAFQHATGDNNPKGFTFSVLGFLQ